MTMPTRSGVLVVGTLVYLVNDDGMAAVQADYPDATTAQAAATTLAGQQNLPLLDSATYTLYAVSTMTPASTAPPSRPGVVPANHPSRRGQTDG